MLALMFMSGLVSRGNKLVFVLLLLLMPIAMSLVVLKTVTRLHGYTVTRPRCDLCKFRRIGSPLFFLKVK